jgi:hypothetical protein
VTAGLAPARYPLLWSSWSWTRSGPVRTGPGEGVLDSVLDRLDIPTAAERLGISVEALRKRIARRQVAAVKEDGRWYVLLDTRPDTVRDNGTAQSRTGQAAVDNVQDESRTGPDESGLRELVDVLKAEVEHLRHELEIRNGELQRKDTIIMALAQRAALPAPEQRPEPAPAPAPPRPWWMRLAWWR